jgi:hypothetical protein
MVIRCFHIDWKIEDGERVPVDTELFALADVFAKAELASPLEIRALQRCWVVSRIDSDERPVEVLSMRAIQMVPDCHLFRTKQGPHASKATAKLWQRLNNYLADLGYQGDAFLHMAENETEQGRCPAWQRWLRLAGARNSNRVAIPIR